MPKIPKKTKSSNVLKFSFTETLFTVILDYKSGKRSHIPRDNTDCKAIKQLALGQNGYAINALYSKPTVRDELPQKICSINDECE